MAITPRQVFNAQQTIIKKIWEATPEEERQKALKLLSPDERNVLTQTIYEPPAEPTFNERLVSLVNSWRAASNIMSEAEGDAPARDSLRQCAKELENVLKLK